MVSGLSSTTSMTPPRGMRRPGISSDRTSRSTLTGRRQSPSGLMFLYQMLSAKTKPSGGEDEELCELSKRAIIVASGSLSQAMKAAKASSDRKRPQEKSCQMGGNDKLLSFQFVVVLKAEEVPRNICNIIYNIYNINILYIIYIYISFFTLMVCMR